MVVTGFEDWNCHREIPYNSISYTNFGKDFISNILTTPGTVTCHPGTTSNLRADSQRFPEEK